MIVLRKRGRRNVALAGVVVAGMLLMGIFGGGKKEDVGKVEKQLQRLGGVIRLQGRFASGHGCPITEERALTNAHMVDYRPPTAIQNEESTLPINPIPYRFESLDGQSIGVTKTAAISFQEDLAIISGRFERFYSLAAECPKVGDKLLNLAYSNGSEKGTILPRPVESKVLASVAGKVEYDNSGSFGSSGSCVLNEKDEVVAINSQVLIFENGDKVKLHGLGVLVCGPWQPGEFAPQQ